MKLYVAIGLLLLAVAGCTPTKYRLQADAQANCLINQKSAVAGALPDNFRIDIDPRSRMFDPFDPDVEPMPPDDPLSHRYMEVVDNKRGSKDWRNLPRTPFVENPRWEDYLQRETNGETTVDLREAVELGLLHSRRYQSELEDLYLSALDVSFERFRFDAQFFGGSDIFLTADGRDRSGSGNSSTLFQVSPLRPGNALRVEKMTATGGQLVAGMANSLVWQFAGPNDYSSNTLLNFSLVQPLLRGAGRTRVLERLTISERALLANVRSMERFRRGFYLNIAIGNDPGSGPSRRGGFFGGSGLEGFSGVGGGGFGAVGNFGGFGGGGFGGGGVTGGAGAQGAGGFIGLLQNTQQIRNQRANVAALQESVEQLRASYDAGRIDRFQVDLAQQALYNAQSQLLTAEAGYKTTLDNFKVTLGLPPNLPLKVEDPLLDQFNLLEPDLERVQEQVNELLTELRLTRAAVQRANPAEPGLLPDIDWEAEIATLREQVERQIAAVEEDFVDLQQALPSRKAALERLAARPESREVQVDPELIDYSQLLARKAQRQKDFQTVRRSLQQDWQRLNVVTALGPQEEAKRLEGLVEGLENLATNLLELSLVQAGTRLEAIEFEPIDLTSEEALQIASVYRRDWQNARAQLVDTWRLIYFNANDLKSNLGIVFNGDIGNVGDNPFRLRGSRGRLSAGLQFDAPLTRLSERNVYRQSLIEYQQARRGYYEFRDRISQGLRATLRQLRLNEINFELRRAAVLVAISQVDLTQLRLSQPPKPEVEEQFGATTARDLVQSLSDLLNVQNDFLSVWVNYEVQRLNLEYGLGLMELDPSGVRIDQRIPYQALLANLCPPLDQFPEVDLQLKNPAAIEEPIPLRLPEAIDPSDTELLPAPSEQSSPMLPPEERKDAQVTQASYLDVEPKLIILPPIAAGAGE